MRSDVVAAAKMQVSKDRPAMMPMEVAKEKGKTRAECFIGENADGLRPRNASSVPLSSHGAIPASVRANASSGAYNCRSGGPSAGSEAASRPSARLASTGSAILSIVCSQ